VSDTVCSFGKKGINFFVNSKKERNRGNRLSISMLLKSKTGAFQKKIRLARADFEEMQRKGDLQEKIDYAKSLFDD